MCRQCQGLGEQSPLNERQGLWSGREGVVEVPVVLFGDFEARHSLGKSNKQGNRIDGFSGVIYRVGKEISTKIRIFSCRANGFI